MEDWDSYRLLLALHRGKTLRNAAKILNINHSTVARRLSQFNHKYGNTVIEATPTGYALTESGESLLHTALQLEALIHSDKHTLRAEQIDYSGNITVSIPPAIAQLLLLEDLQAFSKRYPNVKLSVQCSYQLVDIDNCEADIVVRVANEPSEHLVGHRAGAVCVNYYAHKDYLTKNQSKDYAWLVSSNSPQRTQWLKHSPFPNAPIGMVIDDLMVRHNAADQGMGLLYGACYIAQSLNNLVLISEQAPTEFAQIWVLTHPTLINVPRIKLLMGELYTLLKSKDSLLRGDHT